MRLADAHCHLQDKRLAEQLPAHLAAACEAGITAFVCNSTSPEDWNQVATLSETYEEVSPAFGVHPWFVTTPSAEWLPVLEECLQKHPQASVGEIGLDRWITPRDEALQEEAFCVQMNLAVRMKRPVTVHCLKAWDWLQRLLSSMRAFPPGIVLHAFGGSAACLKQFLQWPVFFSFCGGITYPSYGKMKKALVACPSERLLLETDAPDFAPQMPDEGSTNPSRQTNTPVQLTHVLQAAAALRKEAPERLAEATVANWYQVFQNG